MSHKKDGRNIRYSPVMHGLWTSLKRAKIDGRTKLGKAMSLMRAELIAHCGGNPTIPQVILIDRIIHKSLRCFLYERRALANPQVEPGSKDHYIALANSLRLDLQAFGIEQRKTEPMNLHQYISQYKGENSN